MQLDGEKIKKFANDKGLSLSKLLRDANVSRTAYYSLTRRFTVLPKSIIDICHTLGVSPVEILTPEDPQVLRIRQKQQTLEKLLESNPNASRENLWHTLILLDEPPIERLNRSLLRGKGASD